jgi:palmitoyltransferase
MLMIVTQSINAVGLIYFFLTNFYLVLGNTTTLDDLRPNSTTVNPYDLGQWYNFTFYFGTNPVLWFFPVGKPLGDGYHWDKKATNVQLSVHE